MAEKRVLESQHSRDLKEKISKAYKTVSPFEDTPHQDYTWDQLQNIGKWRAPFVIDGQSRLFS